MFKNSAPTILIANGANVLGLKLTEILLDQGSNVIMLDEFSESKIHFARHFRKNKQFIFLEKDSFQANKSKINKLNYSFFILYKNPIEENDLSTKVFIKTTQFIDEIFEFSQDKKAKSILVTSIHAHKKLLHEIGEENAYTFSDIQKYAEKIAKEYISELNLNCRIVRVGKVLGPEMELEDSEPVIKMAKEALTQDYIIIEGDGLEYNYYVYTIDAVYGLIKAIFDEKTRGKVYSLTSTESLSNLSIANKILKCSVKANSIKFSKNEDSTDPLLDHSYIPPNNLTEIGWNPTIEFDTALEKTVEYIREESGFEKIKRTKERFNPNEARKVEPEPDEDILLVHIKKPAQGNKKPYEKKKSPIIKYLLSIIAIGVIGAVFFIAVLPITNAIFISNEQTKILADINKSIETKNPKLTAETLKKLNESKGMDNLESRIKSLEFLTEISGQKNSYSNYLKAFSAYQFYISAVQKINSSETISKPIYEGNKVVADDIYTLQSLNQIKNDLKEYQSIIKDTSLEKLPENTKNEFSKMSEISRNILGLL